MRQLIDCNRQHIGGQSIPETRQRIDQKSAVAIVVQKYNGALAAGVAVGGQQGAHLAHQGIGRRQRIGCRTSGTNRGALAAARADLSIDCHVVARRRDGAGGTQIETASATHDARARMGTKVVGKVDVAGLLEAADETTGVQYGFEHRRRIVRGGANIAIAQLGC